MAKDAGVTFINVNVSHVLDKVWRRTARVASRRDGLGRPRTTQYVGESEKRVNALFSLAHKVAPSILFLDEIDCFFCESAAHPPSLRLPCVTMFFALCAAMRDSSHPHHQSVMAMFLTLWDGLMTDPNERVIVLAATNRPNELDPAGARVGSSNSCARAGLTARCRPRPVAFAQCCGDCRVSLSSPRPTRCVQAACCRAQVRPAHAVRQSSRAAILKTILRSENLDPGSDSLRCAAPLYRFALTRARARTRGRR
jgi:hypothetical protein